MYSTTARLHAHGSEPEYQSQQQPAVQGRSLANSPSSRPLATRRPSLARPSSSRRDGRPLKSMNSGPKRSCTPIVVIGGAGVVVRSWPITWGSEARPAQCRGNASAIRSWAASLAQLDSWVYSAPLCMTGSH